MEETKKQENKAHILVIDDDKRICELVSRFLRDHNYMVLSVCSADEARSLMQCFLFDALIVDVMMPGQNGLEFTQDIRKQGNDTPVLLLTALGEVEDRISGFESGADDYLPKPFEPKEMVLRLESILRRTRSKAEEKHCGYQIGKWYFDPRYDELINNTMQEDNEIRLTSVEANLLRALAESAGRYVSREDLAERCGLDAGERTIDVQVTRLRRKIEQNTKMPKYLQTVRGKGYLLRAEQA
ncbi:MAG: response regulator transcription factor [Alphaproteobacteria bacterium]|nr:response regulator transcription factor [Alphaproteobacteria bacterium]